MDTTHHGLSVVERLTYFKNAGRHGFILFAQARALPYATARHFTLLHGRTRLLMATDISLRQHLPLVPDYSPMPYGCL